MMRTSLFTAAAAGAALALPATAQLSGTVETGGSSTVFPVAAFVAEQFNSAYPDVEVNVQKIGSGGGIEQFIAGNFDAANSSRLIKASEVKELQDKNIEFVETLVAYDGLSIVINTENDWAKEMSVDDLKKIFSADSTASSWKDINPKFPDVPLKIYVPAETSGTFDYFAEEVVGKDGSLRGTSVGENDNLTVTGVSDNKGAIGFLGSAYYFENKDSLTAVAIKNKDGEFVQPTPETIETGTYNPFSRPLFVYWKVDSLNKPEVKEYAEFFLDIAPTASEEVGYVRLPTFVYDAMMERLRDRTSGSIYYTDDLQPKEGSLKELVGE